MCLWLSGIMPKWCSGLTIDRAPLLICFRLSQGNIYAQIAIYCFSFVSVIALVYVYVT